ncbi:spondin-1 [Caerostris extrusa]|uniref:Spondin-1 n=1 Tax=Caerostris extrusa TaxID=172846 RepID=A0AAV4NSM1_CAEEX|nr:spondin-1 [Caerostris extrusa]
MIRKGGCEHFKQLSKTMVAKCGCHVTHAAIDKSAAYLLNSKSDAYQYDMKNGRRKQKEEAKQNEQAMPEKIAGTDPKCAVTHWSEWSPCTVTCGKGLKVRTRLYLSPAALSMCNVELMQKAPCTADKPDCTVNLIEAKKNCMQPKEVGPAAATSPAGTTTCLEPCASSSSTGAAEVTATISTGMPTVTGCVRPC